MRGELHVQPNSHRVSGLVDVLDRVLDKGIVIDAWVALWTGISLVKSNSRLKIASVETYLSTPPVRCVDL